jgi:hypothetical protein
MESQKKIGIVCHEVTNVLVVQFSCMYNYSGYMSKFILLT